MTRVRMMTHVPLIRIDAARVELGGGSLVAVPFRDYDELLLGSFTDERRKYEATAPVFFVSEHDVDVPEGAIEGMLEGPQVVSAANGFNLRLSFLFERWDRHRADCARVRDALTLAAPSSAIPDPGLSLDIIDIAATNPVTQTRQGDADQELLFLGAGATFVVSRDRLERAAELLDTVDCCDGELRHAIDVLHGAADLSLTGNEQLTLCAIELEALLLPELTTELKQTFARRLAHLVGGDDTEAVARAVYELRSDAVHGQAGVQAPPGLAQSLLAGAVVALESQMRDGSTLTDVRARLDAGASGTHAPLSEEEPPPTPRILHPEPRGMPPISSSHQLTQGGLPIRDPEIDEGRLVLFAPLVGLELDILPDELIEVGFPLSWMWPGQLISLEDPDIRRDWIAPGANEELPIACLALATSHQCGFPWSSDFKRELEPLRRRVGTAVTALRLAGLAGVHDPDLLGVYARGGGGLRYRLPAVYRQTVIGQRARPARRLDEELIADLAALWPLLLEYETGRRAPEIDHALSLFRRAHIWLGLSVATRLELLFASLETALGRGAAAGDSLARLAELTRRRHAAAFQWYASHGVEVRNAVAHGEWRPRGESGGGEALSHLQHVLGEVLAALLMAWRQRRKARPAKTLVAALRDPHAELDWRTAGASERRQHELRAARELRYRGLDASIMVERGRMAGGAGDLAEARRCFEHASAHGDVRGDFGLGLLARDAGDLDAARAHLTRALEGGLPSAITELGRIERVAGNVEVARRYLRMAIDQGDPGAIVSLGILERAAGNIDAARALYRRASDAGDLGGTYNLGLLEERAGDREAALRCFVHAAQAGHLASMGWAGDLAHRGGDSDTARTWWQRAAEHGDAGSAGHLGDDALRRGDLAAARSWYERAAAGGSEPAAQRLAQLDALPPSGKG